MKRRTDLTTPRQRRRVGIHYDPDAFGAFSEAIARFLGTGRYLVIQSFVVVAWVIVNIYKPFQFDGYPFIFLTLILSLQASYAAPLILLAQNRQEDRDNEQLERDRGLAARTQADTEYLARELAGVRLVLADLVTMEDLREQTDAITEALEKLNAAVLQQQPDSQPGE
ncbi:MAG: DUF1003 domain-containing protein [Actinobacteria bacterium]|jgi:uncharacterized membrane protein|uniref:Unannotated protein n=1 Tax=freshwater metagenome TaxID=449393 RepID=A0A6J7T8E6_9ZZZZ|nr:DUF1003 domain-containing protein [Actinomycetota bacterium]MTB12497.1 DUF1003 domain-containing protein [Actinomycetota bacterium]